MKKAITYTLLAAPIFLFFAYLFRYALAVPELDDYFAVVGFINDFGNSSTFTEKIALLYGQIAEHRIVLNRLLNLFLYALTGKIQLAGLIYVSNLTVLLLLLVFYHSFQIQENKIWYFLPVPFLFLQQQYNEITLSATASSQHTTVLLFAFLAFYFLSKPLRSHLYLAMLCALLATFTSANGIFTFFIGFLCLLIQKRWRDNFIWCSCAVAVVFIYFFDYEHYGHLKISNIWESPFQLIEYALHFIGASLHISRLGYQIAFTAGLGIIAWFIYLFFKQYYLKNIALTGILLFLLLTAALISLGRFELGFAYRYNLYSAIFLIVSYLSFLEMTSMKWIKRLFPFILMVSICFSLFSYYDYTAFVEMVRREKVANIFNLRHQKEALINYFYGGFLVKASQENVGKVVKANENGIYDLPPHPIDALDSLLKLEEITTNESWAKNVTITQSDTLQIHNSNLQIGNQTDDAVYIIAKSPSKTYLLMTFSEKNSFLTYAKTGFYYKAGFSTRVVKNIFGGEQYHIGLVWVDNKKMKITWTDKIIPSP